MKKSLKVLAFAIALAGLASCGQKPAEFTSVRYDNSFALEEGASDSISITMDIEYPDPLDNESAMKIADAISGTLFGSGYAGMEPSEAAKAWADSLASDYRENNLELLDMLEEEEGPTDAFVAAVNKNISDWLVNHIKQSDKKVAAFVNK